MPDSEDLFPKNSAESADRDGDGLGDNADAYPDNPDEQYFTIDDALSEVIDERLRIAWQSVAGSRACWTVGTNLLPKHGEPRGASGVQSILDSSL